MRARLETERLRLDDWRRDDAEPLAAMNADADVMRYIGSGARSLEQAEAEAAEFLGQPQPEPLGLWAIRDKAGRGFLGWVGLLPLEGGEEIELGYRLPRHAWGRGIASEAAARLLQHGFEDIRLDRIVAVTARENTGSQRVLTKLGFRYRGLCRVYGIDDVWYYDLSARHWRWLEARRPRPASEPTG